MMNEKNLTMNDYELYMDSYEEGKCDVEISAETSVKSHKKKVSNLHSRKKKAFYKSRTRMEELRAVTDCDLSPESKNVIQGILRSHQLPLNSHEEQTFGCSRGNKRRLDAAENKINEINLVSDEEIEIA